jgi:hypothetical protein
VVRRQIERFAADYSEISGSFFLVPFKFHYVARKQIELATCGLQQITAKLWKFFFVDPIQIPLSPDKHTVCPQSPLGVLKNCGAQTD